MRGCTPREQEFLCSKIIFTEGLHSPWSNSKCVLPPGKNWIGVSKIIIYEPLLTHSQKNTKCTYKSSFAKLSKIHFFSENCVFLLKRFCFERIFFLLFFLVFRDIYWGVFVLSLIFVFKTVVLRRRALHFPRIYFFQKTITA